MSRTTRIEVAENPAKKLLKWKSSEGTFQYWDKTLEQNVTVDLPFKFAVLEEKYVSFNGFDEESNTAVWSNEVKDANEMVIVKSGDSVLGEFKKSEWKNVKDSAAFKSANYTQILYAAANFGSGWEICRIMLNKSALTGGILKDKKTGVVFPGQETDGWINFMNNLSKSKGRQAIYDNFIIVNGSKSKKNGAVNFTVPEFDFEPMSQEENEEFNSLAVKVDDYFLNRVISKEIVSNPEKEEVAKPVYDDDLPF